MWTVIYVTVFLLLCESCSSRFTCIFKFLNKELRDQCDYCKETWTEQDFEGLRNGVHKKLFGQHIAQDIVPRFVKIHLMNPSPTKALVLSLHGATGSGKNYLTQITIEHLFHNGLDNIYVKHWSAKKDFWNKDKLQIYKAIVRKTVMKHLSACKRSVFIFDEANDLPVGLLDVLAPMLDENAVLDGVDCTKAIFFFLSNTGTSKINDVVLKLQKKGKGRSAIKVSDFQGIIGDGAFDEKGGFQNCHLIQKNVIDSYVPYLPLEKLHVRQCIAYYLNIRNCFITIKIIDSLAESVNYGNGKFATYGCRGVEDLIKNSVDDECVLKKVKTEL